MYNGLLYELEAKTYYNQRLKALEKGRVHFIPAERRGLINSLLYNLSEALIATGQKLKNHTQQRPMIPSLTTK